MPLDAAQLCPSVTNTAEIKRIFVEGIGRLLLGALEYAASELNFDVLRLETRNRQPEAVALYESVGHKPVERYGEYLSDPHSLCFEKSLVTR